MPPDDELRLRNVTHRKRHLRRMTPAMRAQQREEHARNWRWSEQTSANESVSRPFTYLNWNHKEPNNGRGREHCMQMTWIFNWAWNDVDCLADTACFVCQRSVLNEP